jgi:MFS superfamily sulfate permease-like transporter
MAFVWDTLTALNIFFCVLVVLSGLVAYKRKWNLSALLIGVAYSLFTVSHLATLFGLKDDQGLLLMAIRVIAYVILIYAVLRLGK